MGTVWKIMGKDFKRRLKDPLSLLALLAFPLILALIIGVVFSPMGRTTMPRPELLVADHDRDWLSALMVGMLRQGFDEVPSLDIRSVTEQEGRACIDKGEGSALLIFPTNLTRDYLAGKPIRLTLVKNPSQAILPEITEQYVDSLALVSSYVSRLFSQEMHVLEEVASRNALAPKWEWLVLGDGFYSKIKTVEKYLYPVPIVIAETGPNGQSRPVGSQGAGSGPTTAPPAKKGHFVVMEFILPGLALFGVFFVAQVVLMDIFSERAQHTMARVFTAPVTVSAFLMGKILGGCVISLASLIALQVIGSLAFHMDWGVPALVLLIDVVAVLGIAGLCLLVICLARTQAQASAILSAVILSMALFGGSFVPMFMLPKAFDWFSQFTLNRHLVEAFHSVMFRGEVAPNGLRLGAVALFGVVSSGVGVVLLKRRLGRGL
jgi:ABC-2 type transport system permease protein